jgi:DNA-binding transcriptional LysR family regulator
MMAVVGPNFPVHAVAETGMSIREFATYPLAATYPSYGTRQLLQAAAASEKIILEPILASNSMAILKQFVKAGLGVTCLPEFAVTSELRAGEVQVVAIDHPLLKSGEAHVITRVGRKLSVASNRMLQLMMAHMRAFRP